MWYRELLADRRALIIYAIVMIIAGAFNAWGAGDSGGIYLSQAVAIAAVAACVFALVIGMHLGNERKNTAHFTFVRPISRSGYAWTVFAVDIGSVAVAYIVGLAALVLPYQLAHGFPAPDLHGISPLTAAILPFAGAFAWYGIATLTGVATRGARSAAVLLGPVALALWCGAVIYPWHAANVFRALSIINPLMYLFVGFQHIERAAHPQYAGSPNGFYDALPVGADASILLIIGMSALLAATFAWQRAEA